MTIHWPPTPNPVGFPPLPGDSAPWASALNNYRLTAVERGSTLLVAVLDRSGSMQSTRQAAEDGFAEFLAGQRAVPGKCLVSLAQFDDQYEMVYAGQPIENVPRWSCVPRGNTALVDAVGRTTLGVLDGLTHAEKRPERVFVIVVTDGEENSSREWTTPNLARLVGDCRGLGWEFVFIGSNMDAWDVAGLMGFARGSTVSYAASAAGTSSVMDSATVAVAASRMTGAPVEFDDEDRVKAMDGEPAHPKGTPRPLP